MINETSNFSTPIIVKDMNNYDVQVAYLSASLDKNNQNFNVNMSVSNKDLVASNASEVKQQYTDFMATVTTRAKDLGYVIF
jgi:hypothetical protein